MNNSKDTISRLATLLWLLAGIVCMGTFIFQATPVLLGVLDPMWLQLAGIFLIFFSLGILTLCSVFWFSWLFEELQDFNHFRRIRRQMRELDVSRRKQDLLRQQKRQRHIHVTEYRQQRRRLYRRSKKIVP